MNNVKNTIEWADYTWNPIKGVCPMSCEYCYAKRIYRRFKMNPAIRFDEKELHAIDKIKKSSRIFVGSTIEMYHENVPHEYISAIIAKTYDYPQHQYFTLTKLPLNLKSIKFPDWWWIGVTICYSERRDIAPKRLPDIKDNRKFVSIEPLLNDVADFIDFEFFDWIIVGGLTPKPVHKKEWIDKILEQAKEYNKPVFIKNNAHYDKTIKEFAKIARKYGE